MKKILFPIIALCISFNTNAQTISLTDANDANAFLQAYLSPLGESLGAGLNNGWYNTAKPHKLGGFDVTLTINSVLVPEASQSFNPNDLENFSSTSDNVATVLGKGDASTITYSGLPIPATFTMPEQKSSLGTLPVPMLGAGIGLIKKTEIDIRFIPTYKYNAGFIGEGSIGLWGIGLKHDILQWIPFIGDAIPISLSLQAGHTNLNTQFEIESNGLGQDVELDVKATTINLIASRKILMLTGYAGIGYNSSTTSFNGNTSFQLGAGGQTIGFDVPLDMQFESQNEFRANVGIRFNITVIALQANYTFSKYPTATVGLGVSLR